MSTGFGFFEGFPNRLTAPRLMSLRGLRYAASPHTLRKPRASDDCEIKEQISPAVLPWANASLDVYSQCRKRSSLIRSSFTPSQNPDFLCLLRGPNNVSSVHMCPEKKEGEGGKAFDLYIVMARVVF